MPMTLTPHLVLLYYLIAPLLDHLVEVVELSLGMLVDSANPHVQSGAFHWEALSSIHYISEICQRTRRKRAHFGHSTVGNPTYAALHPEVEGLNPEDYPRHQQAGHPGRCRSLLP